MLASVLIAGSVMSGFTRTPASGEERSLIILSPLECYHVHDVCTCRETCT
nr:MAG TPA: hypothetical protein [Caudoviricetes sp.]